MAEAAAAYSPAAEDDLIDIWFNIALDNSAAADRTIDKIKSRVDDLLLFPQSGPARPDIAPDTRSVTVGPYLVLYRLASGQMEVIRVVHGARDLPSIVLGPSG